MGSHCTLHLPPLRLVKLGVHFATWNRRDTILSPSPLSPSPSAIALPNLSLSAHRHLPVQCGAFVNHTDPIVLRRLRECPALLEPLPFDPEFPFNEVYLHRTHTSNLMYDSVTRQGAANAIEKVAKLGAETQMRRAEVYVADAQAWLRQLAGLVGDEAWYLYSPSQQLALAVLRGQYEFFVNTPAPVQPLGKGGGRLDAQRWNIPNLGGKVLRDKLLSVLENQRSGCEDLMCSVGAEHTVAIDWCVHSGKLLGAGRLANVVNEDSVLMASKTTQTERMEELLDMFHALRARPNFKAIVAVIDKVRFPATHV